MKNKNLFDSFNNAIKGIIYAIKSERNMKIHVAVNTGSFYEFVFRPYKA